MKERQSFNLDGRIEIGKLEMSKEVVVTLIGMGILALFAFGFFFASIYLPLAKPAPVWLRDPTGSDVLNRRKKVELLGDSSPI